MIARNALRVLPVACTLLLTACAANTHSLSMQLPATGQRLSGALSTGGGARSVTLTADDGRLACNGVSLLEYATPGCRTSGSLRLQCTDGRDVTGSWKMDDCASGQGSGADNLGNAVVFFIGSQDADTELAVTPAQVPRTEPHPVVVEPRERGHLFRFGGDYAAGFGSPGHFPYDTVFNDTESGLLIVQLGGPERLPMSLADGSLEAGAEAFVVMPPGTARVERIRVEAEGGGWRISGGVSLPSGLPVMNLDGQVIALTDGENLVAAQAMRRYLLLVAPALAGEAGVAAAAEQLRERILTRYVD